MVEVSVSGLLGCARLSRRGDSQRTRARIHEVEMVEGRLVATIERDDGDEDSSSDDPYLLLLPCDPAG